MLLVTPFETSQRHLRHVSDWSTYKKLHSTLPVIALSALKARVRAGDPKVIRDLWATRDKTFLAIDFEWLERNDRSCVEWGYAAIRSSHLEAYVLELVPTRVTLTAVIIEWAHGRLYQTRIIGARGVSWQGIRR